MSILHVIHKLGQSLWYDNMKRGLIENGGFAKLISAIDETLRLAPKRL